AAPALARGAVGAADGRRRGDRRRPRRALPAPAWDAAARAREVARAAGGARPRGTGVPAAPAGDAGAAPRLRARSRHPRRRARAARGTGAARRRGDAAGAGSRRDAHVPQGSSREDRIVARPQLLISVLAAAACAQESAPPPGPHFAGVDLFGT